MTRKHRKSSSDLANTEKTSAMPSHYVGIGASAGGLEALETFFKHMPPSSGLAFVIVQHLSPDYKSLMVEILSKRTQMPVFRAEDGMTVAANSVYLIPPKKNLTIFHGRLILSEQDRSRGLNLPIDIFFRSLAEDQAERVVGVILSGTGSDGTRGVRTIKEYGGMVMVQNENSAKFDGMPRAAISTGVADFVLPPEDMPGQLLAYTNHPYVSKSDRDPTLLKDENGLTHIFSAIRDKCKVDFTYYKPSTVMRRIERRMVVNQVESTRDYVAYLKNYPGEVIALYRELLIGVTSFFRDTRVFQELRDRWLPELLKKDRSREIRLWVAGCSTGEEAYTLAILTRECMESLKVNHDVKVFATDVDRNAILVAQNGSYHESIAADTDPRLLSKYFYQREDRFQVTRNIREMVVFAQHNLIKDPPFTKIDLISCRNLLIYLQPVLQKRALESFNFSLKPEGILLLGTSESTGEMSEYFDPLSAKNKIYRSRGRRHQLSGNDMHLVSTSKVRSHEMRRSYPGIQPAKHFIAEEHLLDRFLQTLSGDYVPLSLVINEHLEVLHVLGESEGYLKVPSGRMLNDISKMAVKEIAIPLSTGIQKVFRTGEELRYTNIGIRHANEMKTVQIRIKPFPDKRGQDPMVSVFLEEIRSEDPSRKSDTVLSYDLSKEAEQHIRDLEQELQFTRENLQATVEELETANEELQATNEELLASNEELQSTNQELQSTNEELHTVNMEHQNKILELTQLNNDVENLLSNTQFGKLMLDENLEIRRFSAYITRIFKILDSDVGRPITHLSNHLVDEDPIDVVREVMRTGQVADREVRSADGEWYLMRVLPYQIGPDHFSGTVLSFINISAVKATKKALAESEKNYRILFETMTPGAVFQDAEGQIISANPAAERILGLTKDQMMGRSSLDPRWKTIHEDGSDFPGEAHPAMIALETGKTVENVVMGIFNPKEEKTRWINVSAIPQYANGASRPHEVYTTFDDISERIRAEQELKKSNERLHFAFEAVKLAWWERNLITDEFLVSDSKFEMIGFTPDEAASIPDFWDSRLHPDDRESLMSAVKAHLDGKKAIYEAQYRLKNRQGEWKRFYDRGRIAHRDADGKPVRLIGAAMCLE